MDRAPFFWWNDGSSEGKKNDIEKRYAKISTEHSRDGIQDEDDRRGPANTEHGYESYPRQFGGNDETRDEIGDRGWASGSTEVSVGNVGNVSL